LSCADSATVASGRAGTMRPTRKRSSNCDAESRVRGLTPVRHPRQTGVMADAKDHVDVVYLPYLPLKNRATVGDWELIPSADLRTADCLDERAEELARGLGEMYVLPRDHRTGAGAFARPRDGHVGDDA